MTLLSVNTLKLITVDSLYVELIRDQQILLSSFKISHIDKVKHVKKVCSVSLSPCLFLDLKQNFDGNRIFEFLMFCLHSDFQV